MTSLFWPTANFIVFAIALGFLYRKHVAGILVSRRGEIQEMLTGSKHELEAAEADFRAAQLRLEKLPEEILQVEKRFALETENIVRSIRDASAKQVEQMHLQITNRIEREQNEGSFQLRRELIERAMRMAEAKLKTQMNDEWDRGLRDQLVAQVVRQEGRSKGARG